MIIETVGVVGAGQMGSGIAQPFLPRLHIVCPAPRSHAFTSYEAKPYPEI